jgi:hypothetical protein
MPILVNNTGAGGAFEKVKIPPNNYKATLSDLKIEQKPDINNPGQMADTLVWYFLIAGKTKDVTIEHWSGPTASLGNEKSWSRRFYMALTGQAPPAVDGQTYLEDLIGLQCMIRVADHTTGKGDVVSKIKDAYATPEPGTEAPF